MRNIIVGTAGHIDHGKTSLIKALNGFDGDTLKEEKQRGITIDLSFSNLENEDTNISFIDVPGHEKLIKNMIAGAFGFDATLLVVDAKEGVMAQTIEHLEVLNILNTKNILVAITKCDIATKDEILQTKKEVLETIKRYKNLFLLDILEVSIYNLDSINKLKTTLFELKENKKPANKLFRYYIDRSFSLKGIGSVVTGTILDGILKKGDSLVVAQLNSSVKVKNLQVHNKDVDIAYPSSRVAINLQTSKPLKRGYLLTKKGYLRGFNSIDVWIESILDNKIKHNTNITFHIGTAQLNAKVLLLDELQTSKGFAKIKFEEKVFAIFDEPFIISVAGRIVGGGRVLNPINEPLKKRNLKPILEALKDKEYKKAFEILVHNHKKGFGLISSNQRFNLNHKEAISIAKEIDNIFLDEENLVLYPLSILKELKHLIKNIYLKNPYALLSSKSLALKLVWASENLIKAVLKELEEEHFLLFENGVYKLKDIKIDNIDKFIENKIFDILKKDNITPTAPYNIYDILDIDRALGDKALKRLSSAKRVIRLEHNIFVETNNLLNMIDSLREIIKKEGFIDISIFKKYYPISRKYQIAYLEYLDKFSDIKKENNKRFLHSQRGRD